MVVAKSNSFSPITQNRCRWFFSSNRQWHPIIGTKSMAALELLKSRHITTHARGLRGKFLSHKLLANKKIRRTHGDTREILRARVRLGRIWKILAATVARG
jgi:hypothetical protein